MKEQCQRPPHPPTQSHTYQRQSERRHLACIPHLNIKREDSIHFEVTILDKMSSVCLRASGNHLLDMQRVIKAQTQVGGQMSTAQDTVVEHREDSH